MRSLFALLLTLALATPVAAESVTASAALDTDTTQFLIPIAGNVRGARGEHFRTDLTVINFKGTPQLVRIEWIPRPGAPAATIERTIPFLGFSTWQDFVGTELDLEGAGALLVTALTTGGALDPSGQIEGFARIWNYMECIDLVGTVSQAVSALSMDGWRNGSPAYVHGVRQTSQYRTNVGIVNLDRSATRRFRLIVNSGLGKIERTIELPPFTMTQEPVGEGPYGDLSVYVEPLDARFYVEPQLEAFGPWRAYATSIDNYSGSGWVIAAMQPRTDVVYP